MVLRRPTPLKANIQAATESPKAAKSKISAKTVRKEASQMRFAQGPSIEQTAHFSIAQAMNGLNKHTKIKFKLRTITLIKL